MNIWPSTPSISTSQIAQCVTKLSEFQNALPHAPTPWEEEFCQIAHRYYFSPLNHLRCAQVIRRGWQVGFFQDLNHTIDWGCGPASASLAVASHPDLRKQIHSQLLYDQSTTVLKQFSDFHSKLVNPISSDRIQLQNPGFPEKTLLMFPNSLTQLAHLPHDWKRFEALLILEPSTIQDGRKLLDWRDQLVKGGYSIWAPCTHQQQCPLRHKTETDWCYDTFHFHAPDWFYEVENLIQIKTKTVSTSYLLARKKAPPPQLQQLARITGDRVSEDDKTRQLVCRNDQHEYLRWLHKKIDPQILSRGTLVKIPPDAQKKLNELRLYSPVYEHNEVLRPHEKTHQN